MRALYLEHGKHHLFSGATKRCGGSEIPSGDGEEKGGGKSGKLCQMLLRPVQTAGSTRAQRRALMESFDSAEHGAQGPYKKLLGNS